MSQNNLSAISKQRAKKKCYYCGKKVVTNHWNDHFKSQHPGEEKREL